MVERVCGKVVDGVAGDSLTRQQLLTSSYLETPSTDDAALAEKVDDEVEYELDDLYEGQQGHSKEESETSTDVGQERVHLET